MNEWMWASEHKCMINRKNEPVNMFEQGCEQVSNLVRKTVYEQVHERVNKHKCEQVSRSEHKWANEQECMINRKNEPVSMFAQVWACLLKCEQSEQSE